MRPLMGSRSRKKEGGTDNNVPNSPRGTARAKQQAPILGWVRKPTLSFTWQTATEAFLGG